MFLWCHVRKTIRPYIPQLNLNAFSCFITNFFIYFHSCSPWMTILIIIIIIMACRFSRMIDHNDILIGFFTFYCFEVSSYLKNKLSIKLNFRLRSFYCNQKRLKNFKASLIKNFATVLFLKHSLKSINKTSNTLFSSMVCNVWKILLQDTCTTAAIDHSVLKLMKTFAWAVKKIRNGHAPCDILRFSI